MSNVAITYRQYGTGRITISSDYVSGYRSGNGLPNVTFWRRLVEFAGQSNRNKVIKILIISNSNSFSEEKLFDLSPIQIETVDLDKFFIFDLNKYDLLWFSGLPNSITSNISEKIANWVQSGGNLFIEVPNQTGDISVLESIEDVEISTIQKPTEQNAYWTFAGKNSYIYTENAKISFQTKLDSNVFGSDWRHLMTDQPTSFIQDSNSQQIISTNNSYISDFSIGFGSYLKNGVVVINEDTESSSSSSEGNSSSSLNDTTSSSSSSSGYLEWNLCDNILANWKMSDNSKTSIVLNSQMDIDLMGIMYEGSLKLPTQAASFEGYINKSLYFNGVNNYIKTLDNTSVNFNLYSPFSLTFIVKKKTDKNQVVILKNNVWELGINENGSLYLLKQDITNGYVVFTTEGEIFSSETWKFVTFTYDGTDGYFYIDSIYTTTSKYSSSYNGINNQDTSVYIASDASNSRNFHGYLEDFKIYDKKLLLYEVISVFNDATQSCQGYYLQESSSSSSSESSSSIDSSSSESSATSSSSFDESSSSSIDSSSSSSVDSNSSSSSVGSSSSSSIDSKSSSSSSFNADFRAYNFSDGSGPISPLAEGYYSYLNNSNTYCSNTNIYSSTNGTLLYCASIWGKTGWWMKQTDGTYWFKNSTSTPIGTYIQFYPFGFTNRSGVLITNI